jgi:hypothetical protein
MTTTHNGEHAMSNPPSSIAKSEALDIIEAASNLADRCGMDRISSNEATQQALKEQDIYEGLSEDDIATLGSLVQQMVAIMRNA